MPSDITATTDASGNYSFSVSAGGSYTVTPALGSDTFSPAGQTINNLNANQTQNFTASAIIVTANNGFTVDLSYTGSSFGLGTPEAGAGVTVSPHAPGFTIAPFGSQDLPFKIWTETLTANFLGNAFTGMNFVGSMPHLASGGGQWTTTFTLLNNGTAPANLTLNFFDDNGHPLALPVIFPQSNAGTVTDSTFTGPLAAGAGLVIQTAGLNNPLATGWAQLLSDGDVSGFAVFTDNVTAQQQQQAVVPLQSINLPAYLLWFDITNGFVTSVALANESTQAAAMTLVIRDNTGAKITTQTVQLPAQGHTAFGLASISPMTANLRGTVEFDEPSNGQVSVLGLSFNPASAFTSIPVTALPGGGAAHTLVRAVSRRVSTPSAHSTLTSGNFTVNLDYKFGSDFAGTPPAGAGFSVTPHIHGVFVQPLSTNLAFQAWNGTLTANFAGVSSPNGLIPVGSMAHLASGGGQWTTTFTLLNNGTATANVDLLFNDDKGNALPLPLTFPQGSPDQTTAEFTGTLAAGAGLVIQTAGLNNPLVTGWAQLSSDGDVSGFAVFTDNVTANQQQQAVVPLQNFNLGASYVLWFDNTNGFSTGVALGSSGKAATINLVIKDDTGTILTTQTVQLPANGHTSFDLATFAPATANLRGTVEFSSPLTGPNDGLISVLGLSFNPASAFTSMPVVTP